MGFFVGELSGNSVIDSTANTIRIAIQAQAHAFPIVTGNLLRSVKSWRDIVLSGSRNLMTQVNQEMGRGSPDLVQFNGNDNLLENVQINMDGAMLLLRNHDTISQFQNISGGTLTLGDSVQIRSSSYGDDRYRSCDMTLAPGTQIVNQTLKCAQ